ncbi:protein of unknown function [Methylocaldum szegediense]|uniref:Uncharacterized protein n=1 Tax=Methylocaldum szegediense TaxID=73780 RepID=A0ABN8X317_9GAMM|nr:protein of unknown function [Methylocaldum szegediense]
MAGSFELHRCYCRARTGPGSGVNWNAVKGALEEGWVLRQHIDSPNAENDVRIHPYSRRKVTHGLIIVTRERSLLSSRRYWVGNGSFR